MIIKDKIENKTKFSLITSITLIIIAIIMVAYSFKQQSDRQKEGYCREIIKEVIQEYVKH